MNEQGWTLVELLVVVAIVMIFGGVFVGHLKAYSVEAHVLGAGRIFKGEFVKARSIAARAGVQTALRFETGPEGDSISTYQDGNHNGVRAADISAGIDRRIAGPVPLTASAPGVRVGINPGVPAIPPDTGVLDTSDPVRFGPGNMLSFSPLGTATPGTFYVAGQGLQGAVRVTPGSARVRLMVCRGSGRWVEQR